MTYAISWLGKGQILQIKLANTISIYEIEAIGEILMTDYVSNDDTIHYLFDVSELWKMPTQIHRIKNALEPILRHPKTGYVVMVYQDNPLMDYVLSILTQLIKFNLEVIPTSTEALRFLRAVDTPDYLRLPSGRYA